MRIQVLGTGCSRCKALEANVGKAVQELGLDANVEKITDIKDIMEFGVLSTPGLVIDGRATAAGRVPSSEEIKQMLHVAGGR